MRKRSPFFLSWLACSQTAARGVGCLRGSRPHLFLCRHSLLTTRYIPFFDMCSADTKRGVEREIKQRKVELFCIDHLVMVTVEANDEFLYLDLAFPTTKLHGRGMGEDGSDDMEGGLNGMEAAFQACGFLDGLAFGCT